MLSGLVQDTDYILFGSFIEIYNEKIYDLLVPLGAKKRSRDELRIRQDAKGPFVGGVREIQIDSADEAYRRVSYFLVFFNSFFGVFFNPSRYECQFLDTFELEVFASTVRC